MLSDFPRDFSSPREERHCCHKAKAKGSRISLIFGLGNLAFVHPTEMKFSKAADTHSGEGDGEINGKQRKAQRATGN